MVKLFQLFEFFLCIEMLMIVWPVGFIENGEGEVGKTKAEGWQGEGSERKRSFWEGISMNFLFFGFNKQSFAHITHWTVEKFVLFNIFPIIMTSMIMTACCGFFIDCSNNMASDLVFCATFSILFLIWIGVVFRNRKCFNWLHY